MPDTSFDESVYRANAPDLIRYATVLVGPSDAADVMSDAVVRAFRSPAWATVVDPRAYLFRAVLNEAMSFKRSAARRRGREARALRLVSDAAPPVSADALDARRALSGLSDQQRAVVYLTYWEDMTTAQVAAALATSEGSVKKQLARARQHLRRILDA